MKKIFSALLLLSAISANAQDEKVERPRHKKAEEVESPAKVAYFELGGPGFASLNYDMRFTKSEKGIGGRVGIGGFSLGEAGNRSTAIFIPIGINYMFGGNDSEGKRYFEIGGGMTVVSTKDTYDNGSGSSTDKFSTSFGHLNFGYRMQPQDGGFFFRATLNPLFGKGFFWPIYGGVSFGYKF
ncbi:hypothetical protein ACQ33O_13465 [Ferruginibacter sp. SUN002]|uniref:hypothetical protein n=1 Tax=Ferruginibacter sp. SUN002 TaxID=2937789 RepID=UPI003D365C18